MSKQETINLVMNASDEEEMIRWSKTGCQALNEAVLLCFDEYKDWRKCQKEVMAFKTCFETYTKSIKQDE